VVGCRVAGEGVVEISPSVEIMPGFLEAVCILRHRTNKLEHSVTSDVNVPVFQGVARLLRNLRVRLISISSTAHAVASPAIHVS